MQQWSSSTLSYIELHGHAYITMIGGFLTMLSNYRYQFSVQLFADDKFAGHPD
jgi:hypothetical protein